MTPPTPPTAPDTIKSRLATRRSLSSYPCLAAPLPKRLADAGHCLRPDGLGHDRADCDCLRRVSGYAAGNWALQRVHRHVPLWHPRHEPPTARDHQLDHGDHVRSHRRCVGRWRYGPLRAPVRRTCRSRRQHASVGRHPAHGLHRRLSFQGSDYRFCLRPGHHHHGWAAGQGLWHPQWRCGHDRQAAGPRRQLVPGQPVGRAAGTGFDGADLSG